MVKKKSLKTCLMIEHGKLRASALRDPRTTKDVAIRMRLHRVESIIKGRYGNDYLFELQRQRLHKVEI
jgi:hypothetical protein